MSRGNAQVAAIVEQLSAISDCRTPITFLASHLPPSKTPLDFVQIIGEAMESYVEAFHCEQDDDEARVGRRIDRTIAEGDWLVVSFSPTFSTERFLRFVGRRMITMMPDAERRPNVELFRLWLCLPEGLLQPTLFKQVAIEVSPRGVFDSGRNATIECERNLNDRSLAKDLLDEDTEEHVRRQVGPLFHRRLELTTGRTPQSTHRLSATLHRKRVQSAAPLRIINSSKSSTDSRHLRPKSSSGASQEVREHDLGVEREFEKTSADAVQAVHGALLKTFAFDRDAAMRMLRHVEALGRLPSMAANDGIPGGSAEDLVLDEVLGYSDDRESTWRRGSWRKIGVLVEQMSALHAKNTMSDLIHLRFHLRHPNLMTPLALVREPDFSYLIFDHPTNGPVTTCLRRLPELATDAGSPRLMRYVAAAARCVCVALLHLHREGFVHRDLVARNIYDAGNGSFRLLLTSRLQRLDKGGMCSSAGVPIRWSSPDALASEYYGVADDVWQFGTLMWEMLSGASQAPFAEHVHADDVVTLLLRGTRLQRPQQADPVFWDRVVAPCFARNSFRTDLEHLYKNIVEYSGEHSS